MIDIHSHFLPGIDDGADSVECSIKMLEDLKQQGVTTVVSTSHYYEHKGDINSFLSNRENSFNHLSCEMAKYNLECFPDIVLGAEVALTPNTPKLDDLDKLCIGNTNSILIELPYNGFYDWITYAIYEIISKYNLVPILAHFERFSTDKKKLAQYESLLSLDVKVQINTESMLYKDSYKVIKSLVKMGKFDVIGSDAHNMGNRKSTFAQGVKRIEKKFGKEYLIKLDKTAEKLIGLV